MFVSDTVAVGRAAEGRQRIEKAGCQPSQSAIAQRRVRLVANDRVEIDAEIGERLARCFIKPQIDHCVFQQPADQELHRQVVDPLFLLFVRAFGGSEPGIDNTVANGQRQRHAPVIERYMRTVLAERVFEVVFDCHLQIVVDICWCSKNEIAIMELIGSLGVLAGQVLNRFRPLRAKAQAILHFAHAILQGMDRPKVTVACRRVARSPESATTGR